MKINYKLSKSIEFLSILLIAHKEGGFTLFHLLFGVVSGTFQAILAFYGLFQVVPLLTSDGVTECFDVQIYFKSASRRSYYKVYQPFLQSETSLMYVLQSKASVITKWESYFVLQSGTSAITK